MKEDVVIRTISRISIPFIQLFGLYTIVHGASSAGGGFQGGVIMASSFILFGVAFGIPEARKRFGETCTVVISSLGVFVYALVGLACIVFGGYYLGYGAIPLPLDSPEIRAAMVEAVEIGIGITVLAVMVSIFYDIAHGDRND